MWRRYRSIVKDRNKKMRPYRFKLSCRPLYLPVPVPCQHYAITVSNGISPYISSIFREKTVYSRLNALVFARIIKRIVIMYQDNSEICHLILEKPKALISGSVKVQTQIHKTDFFCDALCCFWEVALVYAALYWVWHFIHHQFNRCVCVIGVSLGIREISFFICVHIVGMRNP